MRRSLLLGSGPARAGVVSVAVALPLVAAMALVYLPGRGAEPGGQDCPPEVRTEGAVPAADEVRARELAQACAIPVEVTSGRGFNRRTWAQPSGSLRSEIYAVPRWTREASGEWVDVNTALRWEGDGSVRAAATVSEVRLSGGGDGPFATLTDPAGGALSLTWPGRLPEPTLVGDTATYAEVLPGVDLTVTAGADGFSYGLVVHTADAAANPALARVKVGITGDGLDVSQRADGRVAAVGPSGKLVFASGPALMWDSSGAGGESSPPAGLAAADVQPRRMVELPVELAGDALVVVPDREMLADPKTQYPVVIDPPFVGDRIAWATVHREQSSRGWTSDSAWPRAGGMRVGLCTWDGCLDATGLWRSVVRFDTGGLGGRHILSAAVKMTQTHTGGCGTYPLRLYQVSGFSSGVSWSGVDWHSHLQNRNVASSNSGCGSGNQSVTFNNSDVRSRVQHHANESYDSISFGVRSGDEGDRNHWRRISRNSLRLEVEYASYPKTPTNLSTDGTGCASAPGAWLTTGRPTLSARPRNDDGKGRLRLAVRRTGTTSTDVYSYRSGVQTVNTTVSHRVSSSGALPDGSYRWWARTESNRSGVDASSYSSWCYFRVDTTPPPAPSATQVGDDAQLGDPVEIGLEVTFNANTEHPAGFRYRLLGGPTQQAAPDGLQQISGGRYRMFATVTVDPPDTTIDHQLQAWTVDEAGNLSDRSDLWFTTGKDLSRLPVAGAWRFDGDWRDDSGDDHQLTPAGGADHVADRVGRPATATGFGPAGESYLRSDGPVLDTTSSYTVAAWAMVDDSTQPHAVVTQAGQHRPSFYLQYYPSHERWEMSVPATDEESTSYHVARSAEVVETGRWYHLAAVVDLAAGQVRLFVGGELQDVVDAPVDPYQADGDLLVGAADSAMADPWRMMVGAVDDVVAYQGVLTGERIQRLMTGGPPAGQVSWWPLRGGGADEGPAGADLAVPAGASWQPDSHGRAGSALRLDGTGCAATTGPVVRTDDSFTVAAWVWAEAGGTSEQTVLSLGGQNAAAVRLQRSADNRWGFVLAGSDAPGADRYAAHAPPEATIDDWQHLTGVYDAGAQELRLYVDGVAQQVVPAPASMWRAGGAAYVGCAGTAGGTGEQFGGAVHDVRLWRGAATPQQVRAVAVERVSFWALDGGGLDAWGGNQLSLVGDYEWVDDRFGWPGSAFGLSLDGSGWAETTGPVVSSDESFTVSAWVKLDDKSDHRTVVAQAGSEVASFNLNYHAGADRWQFSMATVDSTDSVSWQRARSLEAPKLDTWYHLAGIYDLGASELSLYVNGKPQQTIPGPEAPWRAGGPLLIGSAGNTTGDRWNPMVGAVDMVRVYSGALDQPRIVDQGVAATFGTVQAGFTTVEQGSFDTTVAQVPVTLAEPVDTPVTVEYESVAPGGSGYAVPPDDFEPVAGTLSFQPGEMSKTIPVTVNGDPDQRQDLLAAIELRDPTNAAVDGGGAGGVWIVAGEPAPGTQECGTDAYGHTCEAGPRSFAPTTEELALTGDDGLTEVALPFQVWLYGQPYERAWVDTNGVLTFQEQEAPAVTLSQIPSEYEWGSPNAAVYPFWHDWVVDGDASVRTGLVGTAPQRRFVVEWRDVAAYDDPGTRVSFQVVLHETGRISIAWDGIDADPVAQGAGGVVGIENLAGTDALAYSQFTASLASGEGVLFTPPAPGSFSGVVTDAAGDPLAGAPVRLNPAGWTTTTDADGSFTFADVPVGQHAAVAGRTDGVCAGPDATAVMEVASGGAASADLMVGAGTDGFGNTCTEQPQEFLPTTDELVSYGYYGSEQVALPFPVTLYGQTYDTAWVDIDGVVNFLEEGPYDGVSPIPSVPEWGKPNAAIYPFWSDWIVSDGASIRTGTVGSAPQRQFVIEWRDVWSWDWSARVSFQLVLHESGDITVAYEGIDPALVEQGLHGVVGIEDADGTEALVYSQFTPVLHAGGGVRFQPPPAEPAHDPLAR